MITGKMAHLVRNQGIPPESILALAFNRKAALEIRERLPEDLKGAQVSTFHSFALKVVASKGAAPTISKLAQDDFAYSKALERILDGMMAEPKTVRLIIQMASSFSSEYREPFDFTNPTEYEEYVRDAELRTLNGELVKSFEELTVANFLAAKGLKYTYEQSLRVPHGQPGAAAVPARLPHLRIRHLHRTLRSERAGSSPGRVDHLRPGSPVEEEPPRPAGNQAHRNLQLAIPKGGP